MVIQGEPGAVIRGKKVCGSSSSVHETLGGFDDASSVCLEI